MDRALDEVIGERQVSLFKGEVNNLWWNVVTNTN